MPVAKDPVAIERTLAEKMRDVVRRLGDGDSPRLDRPESKYRGRQPNIQFVRVTGAIDGGYYPGVVTVYDAVDEAWVDLGDVWVFELNDGLLACEKRYCARQSGLFENGEERAVFIAFSLATRELEVVTAFDDVTCEVTAETITVVDTTECAGGGGAQMDFSDAANAMYVGTVI